MGADVTHPGAGWQIAAIVSARKLTSPCGWGGRLGAGSRNTRAGTDQRRNSHALSYWPNNTWRRSSIPDGTVPAGQRPDCAQTAAGRAGWAAGSVPAAPQQRRWASGGSADRRFAAGRSILRDATAAARSWRRNWTLAPADRNPSGRKPVLRPSGGWRRKSAVRLPPAVRLTLVIWSWAESKPLALKPQINNNIDINYQFIDWSTAELVNWSIDSLIDSFHWLLTRLDWHQIQLNR